MRAYEHEEVQSLGAKFGPNETGGVQYETIIAPAMLRSGRGGDGSNERVPPSNLRGNDGLASISVAA